MLYFFSIKLFSVGLMDIKYFWIALPGSAFETLSLSFCISTWKLNRALLCAVRFSGAALPGWSRYTLRPVGCGYKLVTPGCDQGSG